MTKLDQALAGVTRLGFDTSPVIYFIEANPRYDALVTEIFQRVSGGISEGITSVITLTEVLIHPLRRRRRSSSATIQRLADQRRQLPDTSHRHQDRGERCGLACPIQPSDPRCPAGSHCTRRGL